ncbi:HIRAN domain-containing protein [Methylobacterium sp. J-068]|uniref:HIRAN domain-containing protein n=1 Tax=Methylobacterium sp. J-068 TaxID=2836649 RepID=UPI001FB8A527|nr:HIRAN domain-containing protein [Methylobacterium sp. J-068]MCJ2035594.1 HIRAN domain-containing protein [Methylobacterium sp. J-068]
MADAVPDLSGLLDAPVGIEAAVLAKGEPWFSSEIAGLQFYRYDARDEMTGTRLRPQPGDRLHIVRDPENEYDGNACQIWWRNEHMLGHLPRYAAAQVAPLLDAGAAARVYVVDPGDGEAWSLRALVVGAAATPLYERHIEHVVRDALEAPARPKRERRLQRRAERFTHILQAHRRRRLADAAETLMAVGFEPALPAIGSRIDLSDLAGDLACSDSTVVRIGKKAGVVISRYDYYAELTQAFADEIRAWARAPRSKLDRASVYVPRIQAETSANV